MHRQPLAGGPTGNTTTHLRDLELGVRETYEMTDGEIPDVPDWSTEPRPQHAWSALGNVSDWIRHGDAKIGVTLAFSAGSGALLFNLFDGAKSPGSAATAFGAICAVALVASCASAIVGLIPQVRVGKNNQPEEYANLIFYRHIARGWQNDIQAFVFKFGTLTMDNQELTKHLGEQIHANALVATRKFAWADRAIKALAIGLLFLALAATAVVW